MNSDDVLVQGEVVVVDEALDCESNGGHNDEEDANGTLVREEGVTKFEVDVIRTNQKNEEEQVAEDVPSEDRQGEEEDDEDMEISDDEARLRRVVMVVEDIPMEDIEIVDGKFVRVKVDVRFDVRFELDRHSTPSQSDRHGQEAN